MIVLVTGLFWGFVLGYLVCMRKVNALRCEINMLKIDLVHESKSAKVVSDAERY